MEGGLEGAGERSGVAGMAQPLVYFKNMEKFKDNTKTLKCLSQFLTVLQMFIFLRGSTKVTQSFNMEVVGTFFYIS